MSEMGAPRPWVNRIVVGTSCLTAAVLLLANWPAVQATLTAFWDTGVPTEILQAPAVRAPCAGGRAHPGRNAVADAPSAPKPITVVRPDSMPSAGGFGPAGGLQRGRRLASPREPGAGGPPACRSHRAAGAAGTVSRSIEEDQVGDLGRRSRERP